MALRRMSHPDDKTAPAEVVTAAPQASPAQLTHEQKRKLQRFVDVFLSSFKITLNIFERKIQTACVSVTEESRERENVLNSMEQMPLFVALGDLLVAIEEWEKRQNFMPPRKIAAKLGEFKNIIDRVIELLKTTANKPNPFSLDDAAWTIRNILGFLNDHEIGSQPFDINGMLVSRYTTVHEYRSLASDRFPREWAE